MRCSLTITIANHYPYRVRTNLVCLTPHLSCTREVIYVVIMQM